LNRSTHLHRIRNAREHFLGNGEVPEGLLPDSIHRSWERCLQTGLSVDLKSEIEPADNSTLSELREQSALLLTQAQPEMENLYAHIIGTQSMVILSDAGGTILHALGDPDFMNKAQRVALQPGVSWSEDRTGTNAIGTALIEKNPVFVMGAEHYFERNAFLNCSAAPILDPFGSVIGVLDLSGDHRQPQEHTMALVRMSAQMIENRLFNVHFAGDITLRFHTRPEFIGTLWEGIAVFSAEGSLLALNRSGAFQLGINERNNPGIEFCSLFDMSLPGFLDSARTKQVLRLTMRNGLQLMVKADPGSFTTPVIKSGPATNHEPKPIAASALDELDTGDQKMHQIIATAKLSIDHDIPILIEGETGTGKELLAKAMHQSSRRKGGAFVAINCASIPEGLIEAELFGHEEGAFTGARRRGAVGRVQQAHGGTLFLDEIGEMPLALQARLLRVIQEREVVPLGSNKAISVDVAIISATNCHLRERVMQGGFREDLYYRLNGLRLSLPALRDRSDLLPLIECILKKQLNKSSVIIHSEVVALMQRHPWRGNIRQLRNVLRSAMIFMPGSELGVEHLPQDFFDELKHIPAEASVNEKFDQADIASNEAALIRHVLAQHGGNMTAAAGHLGISRATVYRKAKRLGLR
jgi:sigma-54 dependent transcriptional regulator, acetoin dehydrogenase operon transcriptional activator AcoR